MTTHSYLLLVHYEILLEHLLLLFSAHEIFGVLLHGKKKRLQGIWQHSTEQNTGLQKVKGRLWNGLNPNRMQMSLNRISLLLITTRCTRENNLRVETITYLFNKNSFTFFFNYKEFPEWLKNHMQCHQIPFSDSPTHRSLNETMALSKNCHLEFIPPMREERKLRAF